MIPAKDNPERVMGVLDHLVELRRRLLASMAAFIAIFILAMLLYHRLMAVLIQQFEGVENGLGLKLFANSLAEGFLVQLQASAIIALIATLPFHLVNAAQFVFPAFGPRTRRAIALGLVASFFLSLLGAYLAYFRVVPFSIRFLMDKAFIPEGVGVLLNYQKGVSYVLSFILWAVITFQAPLALEVLLALGILDRKAVLGASRYVIVGIFIIAAVVTPSVDPISQCAIALPLVALHFAVILIARIFGWGNRIEATGREG
jgi:sec-independent protein translocase protein TatC